MRGACTADAPWHGYRQKFRVFFREAFLASRLGFSPLRPNLGSLLSPMPYWVFPCICNCMFVRSPGLTTKPASSQFHDVVTSKDDLRLHFFECRRAVGQTRIARIVANSESHGQWNQCPPQIGPCSTSLELEFTATQRADHDL